MRKYEADNMNCLQCCIAGMFDVELATVPHQQVWQSKHANWFDGFYNFMMIEHGQAPVAVVDDTLDDLFHIAVIRPFVEGVPHCVLAKGMDVVWDPNKNNKLESLAEVEWEYSILFVQVSGLCLQKACQTSYIQWELEEANEERTTGESRI